jgi:hypothetical protein
MPVGDTRTQPAPRPSKGLFNLLVLVAAGAIFAVNLAVMDAADGTSSAVDALSREVKTPELQLQEAKRTARDLEGRWSRPLVWHGGATEAEALALLLSGEDQASARVSRTTVQLSPVTPSAWLRIGVFPLSDGPISPCHDARSCAAASYLAAPLTSDGALECARFLISGAGVGTGPASPQLYALTHSGAPSGNLSLCLAGYGPAAVERAQRLSRLP